MSKLYSIGIYFASFFVTLLSHFDPKLRLGVLGRRQTFTKLENAVKQFDNTFWFHCASLGEYEQGLPVFKALKIKYPNYKVVLSFFSPSGYEVKKNTDLADVVVYLPLDTKANAKRFITLVNPDLTVFVKYEIWPHFLNELKHRKLNAILISAVFRPNQSFFKWYGSFMKTTLWAFNHIFTQDEPSKTLLERIDFKNVSISGDTRFDRVLDQLKIDNSVAFIEKFKAHHLCFVLGSTWPEDDKLFLDFINNNTHPKVKFIIAPHQLKPEYINSLKTQLVVKTISYSQLDDIKNLEDYKVFLLDTIGLLSKIYSYSEIAYVGGAAGRTGLHNILEPAVFGVPIIIGKNYGKNPEAKQLVKLGGVISVATATAFNSSINALISDPILRKNQGGINSDYVRSNDGAVDHIMDYLKHDLRF